jgi:uncharacterized protein DUF4154
MPGFPARALATVVTSWFGWRFAGWSRVLLFVACCGHLIGAPSADSTREYKIKTGFLFHFAQFVDWPPDAFATSESPFIIGVLGEDVFGGLLDAAVQGEAINSRPLTVRRFKRVEEIDACHILFIAPSESSQLDHILQALGDRSILTVSDTPGFIVHGGMIRFVIENNRIRLKINLAAAEKSHLTLSSKLLRSAEVVGFKKR